LGRPHCSAIRGYFLPRRRPTVARGPARARPSADTERAAPAHENAGDHHGDADHQREGQVRVALWHARRVCTVPRPRLLRLPVPERRACSTRCASEAALRPRRSACGPQPGRRARTAGQGCVRLGNIPERLLRLLPLRTACRHSAPLFACLNALLRPAGSGPGPADRGRGAISGTGPGTPSSPGPSSGAPGVSSRPATCRQAPVRARVGRDLSLAGVSAHAEHVVWAHHRCSRAFLWRRKHQRLRAMPAPSARKCSSRFRPASLCFQACTSRERLSPPLVSRGVDLL